MESLTLPSLLICNHQCNYNPKPPSCKALLIFFTCFRSSGSYQELKSKPLFLINIRQTIFLFLTFWGTSKTLLKILFPFQIWFQKQPNLNPVENLYQTILQVSNKNFNIILLKQILIFLMSEFFCGKRFRFSYLISASDIQKILCSKQYRLLTDRESTQASKRNHTGQFPMLDKGISA